MTREIKFRIWQPDNKWFIFPGTRDFYINLSGETFVLADLGYPCGNTMIEIDDESIVNQFIGLKDLEGTDIYEGDIIENFGATEIRSLVVKFIAPSFCVSFHPQSIGGWPISLIATWKIIGNIYQNPELVI